MLRGSKTAGIKGGLTTVLLTQGPAPYPSSTRAMLCLHF